MQTASSQGAKATGSRKNSNNEPPAQGPNPIPRSSSTRQKPLNPQAPQPQESKLLQSSHSTNINMKPAQRLNSSLHRDESIKSAQTGSTHASKLTKLSQQNISQPRRREPTSRVAPKNQVSSSNQMDNSILSTNMSFNQVANQSMVS
jgi:hypothetical protein